MNIPSLSRRRREPPPNDPRDDSVTPDPRDPQDVDGDGRIDGTEAGTEQAAYAGDTAGPDARPVVTERDGDQATYRSNAVSIGGERNAEAERRAAVARAATARSATGATTGPTGRVAPMDDEPRTPVTDTDRTGSLRAVPTPAEADTDRTGSLRPVTTPAGTDRTDDDRARGAGAVGAAAPLRTDRTDRDDDALRDDDTVRTGEPRTVDPGRADPDATPVVAGPRPRASLLATLGLILSVVGALFVLTGTLAGYGIGLGAVGAVFSVLGLRATRRRHVAGAKDALIGILVGLAAVVLGVIAFTGQFDWPTTDGDWVGRFREWLDSQFVDRF
ncbi:DUF4190 domain-containing protein [Micromonospora sp. NPDC000089]|uniref:DUF4190 domain-containing protein n=1 Tax=unclassified Micromonospora TaxID=2617518 RepID=UPI00368DCC0C